METDEEFAELFVFDVEKALVDFVGVEELAEEVEDFEEGDGFVGPALSALVGDAPPVLEERVGGDQGDVAREVDFDEGFAHALLVVELVPQGVGVVELVGGVQLHLN